MFLIKKDCFTTLTGHIINVGIYLKNWNLWIKIIKIILVVIFMLLIIIPIIINFWD